MHKASVDYKKAFLINSLGEIKIPKKKEELIIPYMSPCNSSILPVKKPNSKGKFVQNLRAINKLVIPRHPVVPNPQTLL